MSLLPVSGRARRLGDDVNTDYIIASRRKKETIDARLLAAYLLEDLIPGFAATVQPGDILVAGRNFGCGSAMEVAVTVPRAAGIAAIVAKSFSRTYQRNAMNNGLLLVTADTDGIAEGSRVTLEADAEGGEAGGLVLRPADGGRIPCAPIPGFMREMLQMGGLVPYLRARGSFGPVPHPLQKPDPHGAEFPGKEQG